MVSRPPCSATTTSSERGCCAAHLRGRLPCCLPAAALHTQEEARLKASCVKLDPVDWLHEGRELLTDISALMQR